MQKTRKITLISLTIGICLCMAVFAFGLMPKAPTAKAVTPTISEISGQSFTDADYKFEGYSLRYVKAGSVNSNSAQSAFRFKMQISTAFYNYLTANSATVKTGTLIYPAYYLADKNPANLIVTSVAGENSDITPIDLDTTTAWEKLEGQEIYESVTYLKEIPAAFYNSDIAVRGYVKVGDNYYYATAPEARSFSWVANQDYIDADSTFNAQDKTEIQDLFLKFPVTIDGVASYAYYGATLTAPTPKISKMFVKYTDGTDDYIAGETPIYGRKTLTSVWNTVENYYSQQTKTATFDIEGLPAGITSAKIDDMPITCTTEAGKVTISNVSDLEMGKNYTLTLEDSSSNKYSVAFKNVAKADNSVPYALNEELLFDIGSNKIDYVYDLDDNEVITDGGKILTGIPANESKNVISKPLIIIDHQGNYYSITLKVVTAILHTEEQARAFFFGTYDDASGKNTKQFRIGSKDLTTLSVALADDFDIGVRPKINNTAYTGTLEGCGHTITFTQDIAQHKETHGLFGYHFVGVMQNVGINYKAINITEAVHQSIIAQYFTSANGVTTGVLDNCYIHVDLSHPSNLNVGYIVGISQQWEATQKMKLNNVLVTRNGGSDYSYYGTVQGKSVKVTQTDFIDALDNGSYCVKTTYFNFNNVYSIVKDGQKAYLGRSNETGCNFIGQNQSGLNDKDLRYAGSYLYNYTEAKTAVKQVGSWAITYNTDMTDIAVNYVR